MARVSKKKKSSSHLLFEDVSFGSAFHRGIVSAMVVAVGLLGFMGYHVSNAQFFEPTQLPPEGQPAGGVGGTQNLFDVLTLNSDASGFTGDTIVGGRFFADELCVNGSCVSDWSEVGGFGGGGGVSFSQRAIVPANGGSYSVGGTFTDVPGANIVVNPSSDGDVMLQFTGEVWVPFDCAVWLQFTVDGSPRGGWPEGVQGTQLSHINYLVDAADVPSGVDHTFKVQAAQAGTCSGGAGAVAFNSDGHFTAVGFGE